MSLKRVGIFGLLLILLILSGCVNQPNQSDFSMALEAAGGVMPQANEFSLTKESEFSGGLKLFGQKDNLYLQLEVTPAESQTAAEGLIHQKRRLFESLYLDGPAPYPGDITQEIVCPEEFRPVTSLEEIDGFETIFYEFYATERFTGGACAEDIAKFKSILAFAYCPEEKKLFQLELFKPKEDFNDKDKELVTGFQCLKQNG